MHSFLFNLVVFVLFVVCSIHNILVGEDVWNHIYALVFGFGVGHLLVEMLESLDEL